MKLFDSAERQRKEKPYTSIVSGTVTNNCELILQGKVLVRIPSMDQEVWARLSSPGAGGGAGLFYVPRMKDEVLVALVGNDPADAFVLGGLWSTKDAPPGDQLTAIGKRVFKTGVKSGVPAHKMEFDDIEQSITIETSTQQKIAITMTSIEISNTLGNIKITLDNESQTLSLEAPMIKIAALATLDLSAKKITINGTGPTTITGTPVAIN